MILIRLNEDGYSFQDRFLRQGFKFFERTRMLFVPWRFIADWKCVSCGSCCRDYSVVLNFQEWLGIIRTYGMELTASDLTRLYLKRKNDGTCSFLCKLANKNFCGLQHMKPDACKLWPFKVLGTPKFGHARQAAYNYVDRTFFVYVDSNCQGLHFGNPTWEFANQTVKEFTEIALGFRSLQVKSTAELSLNFRSRLYL